MLSSELHKSKSGINRQKLRMPAMIRMPMGNSFLYKEQRKDIFRACLLVERVTRLAEPCFSPARRNVTCKFAKPFYLGSLKRHSGLSRRGKATSSKKKCSKNRLFSSYSSSTIGIKLSNFLMSFFFRKSRTQVSTSSFNSVWPPTKKKIMPLLVTAFRWTGKTCFD